MGVCFYAVNPDEDFALNVSNQSARKILIAAGITDEQAREELLGSLTPDQARTAVSVLKGETNIFFQEPYIDGYARPDGPRIINQGYDADRLERLAHWLSILAEHADRAGVNIQFG